VFFVDSFGYAIVTMDSVKLYMDDTKLALSVRVHLGPDVSCICCHASGYAQLLVLELLL
jgi:hypothetical protein